MLDAEPQLLAALAADAQLLAHAMEEGLGADGSFVAVNNRVSQSVPHLHVHVVPRRRKDGLRGFFWPRNPYRDDRHADEVQAELRAAVARLSNRAGP
jgi:histidine triad (HIT) family protein